MKFIDSNGLDNKHHKGLLSLSGFSRRKLYRCMATATGAALCSLTSLAHSLGLGEIQSTTFIGQPLKANIELVSVGGEVDIESLRVRQVTQEEAKELGVELSIPDNLFDLKIDQSQGLPFIAVESKGPVKEPYLNLLVELRWPNGVVYREYPVLLDPPPRAPVATARNTTSLQPRGQLIADPAPAPTDQTASNKTVAGSRQLRLDPLATADGKYRVRSGDTLSKIAERWREGTDRGIYDTMEWLYENNLHAFTNQNIDLLRAGAVLQMPDLSAYVADNEVPTAEEQAKAVQVKEPTEGAVSPESAEELEEKLDETVQNVDLASNEPSKGLLTVGTANQDDSTRELIDLLVRENESLRARMDKIENSEYLETLKQLIILQRQQISDLRNRVGVSDSDNNDEINALLEKIGAAESAADDQPINDSLEVVVNDETLAEEDQSSVSEVELASENVTAKKADNEELAPVKVDPVLSAPVMASKEEKSWLFWIILGGGAAIIAAFAALLVYFRKTSDSGSVARIEDEQIEDDLFDGLEDELNNTQIRPAITEVPGHPLVSERDETLDKKDDNLINLEEEGVTLVYKPRIAEEEGWLGESAEITDNDLMDMDAAMKEVQEAFDDLSLDESVLEELENGGVLEGMTEELQAESFLDDEGLEELVEQQQKKPILEPRSDDEVRLSIAEKMAQYNPEEYRKEIENLGLLELDELNEFDEEHDEIDTTVYRAMMFCEFKKFSKARDLIKSSIDDGAEDERLTDALEQIDALEAALKNDSQQVG